jgi:hypothetical protein
MTRNELKEKIKILAKQVYSKDTPVNLDTPSNINLDIEETFPVLAKFPDLKKTIVDLFTKQYELFIEDIQWVAPRPTTFRILLANGETFFLHYTPRSWVATIEGKKYYLTNLGEEEQAAQTLARVLSYGQKAEATPDEETSAEPAEDPVETPEEAQKRLDEFTVEGSMRQIKANYRSSDEQWMEKFEDFLDD